MFGIVDWLVFGGVLLVSVAVGVFYAVQEARQPPSEDAAADYLLGGRAMPLVPVALSLLVNNESPVLTCTVLLKVSFQSAILVLGTPPDIFYYGTAYWWAAVGISLSALFTCFIFVPVFYSLRLISVYEVGVGSNFRKMEIRKTNSQLYFAPPETVTP